MAAGIRSKLPAGVTFVGAGMTERGRRGKGRLDRRIIRRSRMMLDDVAAHGARHTVGLPDEDGATTQARLVARFRARAGLALHRGLMQAYQMRAQMVQRIWEERTGMSAVTGLELRFQ